MLRDYDWGLLRRPGNFNSADQPSPQLELAFIRLIREAATMKISRLGEAPDYRFSLANERTFLAWIRTALGFLAAGVGLDQLAPDFATPLIRELLALLLCLFAGGLAIYGYLRWLRNEKAMRLKEDLPYTRTLLVISLILTLVAAVVMVLVFYAG
jgi:putative membrane protein